jgi:hypothetical protein
MIPQPERRTVKDIDHNDDGTKITSWVEAPKEFHRVWSVVGVMLLIVIALAIGLGIGLNK